MGVISPDLEGKHTRRIASPPFASKSCFPLTRPSPLEGEGECSSIGKEKPPAAKPGVDLVQP
jgi:hypothetical protein